jgi:hypothetical protein
MIHYYSWSIEAVPGFTQFGKYRNARQAEFRFGSTAGVEPGSPRPNVALSSKQVSKPARHRLNSGKSVMMQRCSSLHQQRCRTGRTVRRSSECAAGSRLRMLSFQGLSSRRAAVVSIPMHADRSPQRKHPPTQLHQSTLAAPHTADTASLNMSNVCAN